MSFSYHHKNSTVQFENFRLPDSFRWKNSLGEDMIDAKEMKKFVLCESCQFDVIPNDDGTCYNCGCDMEPVEVLVEIENSDAYHRLDSNKVDNHLNGLDYYVEQLGKTKFVRVPAFASGRKRYMEIKAKCCAMYGSN